MSKKYVGIDIGGTNLKAGVVDETGTLLSAAKTPLQFTTPEAFVETLAGLSRQAAEAAGIGAEEICAVGMGVPGEVDTEHGTILYTCNIPLADLPVGALFRRYLDVPVYLENDANCALYGEIFAGAGRRWETFLLVTVGTGVGGGIVLDKKIYRGFNGAGGEIGHFTLVHDGVLCTCGNHGCWESYASVTALIRQTEEALRANPDSLMKDYLKEDGSASGRTAFDAAKAGDSAAKEVVDTYLRYVADGITSVINIFQPEVLVIGGGISREGDYLLKPVQEYVAKYVYSKDMEQTQIKIATLFNDAGIIGAALASTAE